MVLLQQMLMITDWNDSSALFVPVRGLLVILTDLWYFCQHPRLYKDTYVDSFFHYIAMPWNSFSTEWFPLLYVLTVLSVPVIGTLPLWILVNQVSYILYLFSFSSSSCKSINLRSKLINWFYPSGKLILSGLNWFCL